MKLRNKETGEIGELCYVPINELCVAWTKNDGVWTKQEYASLAELNEEWEDYEEDEEDEEDDYMPTNAEINELTDMGYGG